MIKIFITGTDTDIGKTYVSTKILQYYSQKGLRTLGMKPVATGCYMYNDRWFNKDAELLLQESLIKVDYSQVNPFSFRDAVSPNIADKAKILTSQRIYNEYKILLNNKPEVLLVEGVGGWSVPINDKETMADFVRLTKLGVIIVVGMKLGCLNHAILTVNNIRAQKVKILGWVANCVMPEMEALNENISTLKSFLNIPFLGRINFEESIGEGTELAKTLNGFGKARFTT